VTYLSQSDLPFPYLKAFNLRCKVHIYAYAHRIFRVQKMAKVISLSEKAYERLKSMKKPGESFSDVVVRVSEKESKKSLLEFAGTWKGDDIDEVFAVVLKEREQAKSREIVFK